MLNIVLWLIFGALVGWVSANAGRSVQSPLDELLHVVVGLLGAFVGGWIMHQLGGGGITSFNISSLGVAIIGASVLLLVYGLLSYSNKNM